MIISRQRGYIFVHIPKTGGTALALALEAKAAKDDILIGDTPKARRRRGRLKDVEASGRLWKHARLRDIEGLVSVEEMEAMCVFTLVRNPWDRMVSYYHWLRAQHFDHPAVARAQAMTFGAFVAHPGTAAEFRASPYPAYVTLPGGAERCDLFLRLERLAEDVATLEARLGFRIGPVPRANASARAVDYRAYYDADGAARVAEICAPDIARFGYGFDDGPLPGA
ncbi:MAG: sulfotransferase family 2 domain-containing protein [Pseudomonadota bacterium]